MTRPHKDALVPGLMEDPVPRMLGGREAVTSEDKLLAERAERFIDETRSQFKHLFIERAPTHLLRRAVEFSASSEVARNIVSALVAKHTFHGYFASPSQSKGHVPTFTESDCEYLEYALSIAEFATRLDDGSNGELVHDYILKMVNDTYSDVEDRYAAQDRIAAGKGYCLIVWVKARNLFQRASITTLERAYDLPFILDHIDEIEARLAAVMQRGSVLQEDLQPILDAPPALASGAL